MASRSNGPARLFAGVLLLLLPLVAVVVAWSIMLFMAEKSSYDVGMRLSPDVSMVVVGDSHSRHSLNPSLIPGLANFGCVGMSVEQSLYKLRDILSVNKDRDFIVMLDISPASLKRPVPPMPLDAFEGRYIFLNLLHWFDGERDVSTPFLLFRDRILFSRSHAFFRRNTKKRKGIFRNNCIGEFDAFENKAFVDTPDKAADACKAYADGLVDFKDDGSAEALYRIMIDEARGAGRRVVLYVAPWHPMLQGMAAGEMECFRRRISGLVGADDIFDFLDYAFDDPDSAFMDQNHLNKAGADIFSQDICPVLTKKGRMSDELQQ